MERPLPQAELVRALRGLLLLPAAALLCSTLASPHDALAQTEPTGQKPPEVTSPAPVGEVIDEDEVLRVDSNLVTIPATVTETTGRPVADLRLQDFELRIDGQPKPIDNLSRADTPLVLAVLFDNSSSLSTAREFEKQAAVRFFRRIVRPIDKASIYSISTVPVLARPLTGNVQVLVRSVEQFAEPEGATALFDTISQAATYLSPFEARKVIVIVSDGNDTISDSTFDQALQRALKAGCQIYAVGTGDIENQNLTDTVARRRLHVLAAQTGGALYVPRTVEDLDAAFEQISDDISQQYVLSYAPTDDPADGRFRAIELNVRNKPTLRVRAREGYYAMKAGQTANTQTAKAPSVNHLKTAGAAASLSVRPRRAGGVDAVGDDARKASAREADQQVASLDPLYAAPSEIAGGARRDVPSGVEISIRAKPSAAKSPTQSGPQDDSETPAPEVSQPPATEVESRPKEPVTQYAPPPIPIPSPTPTYVQTSAPAPEVTKTNEPAPPAPAKEAARAPISGGVLNGRATSLPKPVYTAAAKNAGAKGIVTIEVEIDEEGRVVSARLVSGHPMLQNPSIIAARQARFSPTLLSGQPVRIKGQIVYNFVTQ